MNINKIIEETKKTNWQRSDDFSVTIFPRNEKLHADKILANQDKDTLWEKSVISVEIPPISLVMIDKYLGGEFRISTSKPELFRFSIRFRDMEHGDLRRYFGTLSAFGLFNYVQESYIKIKITNKNDSATIFESEECLIELVSVVNLDSAANSIAEFSVQFVSPIYSDQFLNKLGSAKYIEKFQEDPALAARRKQIIEAVSKWK